MKNLNNYKVTEITEVKDINGGLISCSDSSHNRWSLALNIFGGPLGLLYDAGHYIASQ